MKNNEHEAMGTNESDGVHERLCAYVLGELEGAERAALEAQLAEDAGLRAEKERIEATISLVTSNCAEGESLAPEILGALERAAGPAVAPRPSPAPQVGPASTSPWYSRAPFQAAAGLAAIVTGVLGGRALWSDAPLSTPGRSSTEELARLDERAPAGAPSETLRDFDVEEAQGAVVLDPAMDGKEVKVEALRQELAQAERRLSAGRPNGEQSSRARREGEAELSTSVIDLDGFGAGTGNPTYKDSFGSSTEPGPGSGSQPELSTQTAVTAGLQPIGGQAGGAPAGSADASIQPRGGNGSGAFGEYRGPGDSTPPRAADGSGSASPAAPKARLGRLSDGTGGGSDDFFLGQGQATQRDGENKKVATSEEILVMERARKRAFVGTVKPSGPSSPGPSGPSTPGPSGPGVPRPGGGGGGGLPPASESGSARVALGAAAGEPLEAFVLPEYELEELSGLGEFGLDAEALESLKGLGYLGVDADADDVLFYYDRRVAGRRLQLTPEQVDQLCDLRTARILRDCRRLPNERPRDMFFRFWGDNPFELAQIDNQSTFGVDVDTASYALARRYLNDGHLPTKAQVRTEEFLNYFKPDLAAPTEGVFGIHTELAPSRFGNGTDAPSQRWLLRVGVRGKEVAREERKPLALTFVVDTSGSMKEQNRMELVKHALRLLVAQLDAQDSIAIVGFNNSASVILPMTSAQSRGVVEAAIYGLQPNGGTNAEGGLMLGYEVAAQGLTAGAHNRVVLLSDGVANIGQTDQDRVNASVKSRRDAGIFLNTIGVGMNNHNDVFLEQLANKGDGICNYVDSSAEARRALVDNFVGAFEPIARDVKIQVEFDRQQVYRYRLLGYENRAIADADFRNDAVDAGEVGSGHQVVALYELELTGAQSTEPFADVRLRWKAPVGLGRDPLEDSATEVSHPVTLAQSTTYDAATGGYRRSALVAQFAEILRRSVHARGDSLDELIAESQRLAIQFGDADFSEFVELLHKSRELIVRHTPQHDDLSNCIDAIRRNRILRAQLDELKRKENQAVVVELQKQNDELEARIRELIRNQVQEEMK